MAFWVSVVSLGAWSSAGCGPSLRQVQHSRVYFERCYAADFDPRIALAEKHACWTAWLEHYTIGQPQERTEYARQRTYAIEHGESVPRLPGLPLVAMGPRAVTAVTVASVTDEVETVGHEPAPDPTSAGEPADRVELPTARERRRRAPTLPRTVNATCAATACEPSWQACVDACAEGADACVTACEVELAACARGCF